jgi:hypothetical protein
MGAVEIRIIPEIEGTNLTTQKPSAIEYFKKSVYENSTVTRGGDFPHKFLTVNFDDAGKALVFTNAKRGALTIDGTDYLVMYRGAHSSRTDAEVRKMPTDGDPRNGEQKPIGFGVPNQGVPVVPVLRAMIDNAEWNVAVIQYTAPTLGPNRQSGSTLLATVNWHARKTGSPNDEVARLLPEMTLIPGSEHVDRQGPKANFLVFRHWALTCETCGIKGHATDSVLCPTNPVGLQKRAREARVLRVAEALARRAAQNVNAAQARRPGAVPNVRNVNQRRQ